MPKKISFLIKTIIIFLALTVNNLAIELTIIPLKKPILDKTLINQKITKGIYKTKIEAQKS